MIMIWSLNIIELSHNARMSPLDIPCSKQQNYYRYIISLCQDDNDLASEYHRIVTKCQNVTP